MAVVITVYDISENVRDRLAEKAAERSQSREEYLRQELERIAVTPSVASLCSRAVFENPWTRT